MTAWAVFWTGTVLGIIGLAVGAYGFRQTWREFSTGDRFLEQDIERIKRAGRAARRLVRRVLRLEQSAEPPPISGRGAWVEASDVVQAVGYTGLPSLADDPEGFVAEVEARLGKLHGAVHAVRGQLESEAKAREAADQRLLSDLETKVVDVEGLTRRVAVGGLRAQVVGWSCIALGFALQATATPFM